MELLGEGLPESAAEDREVLGEHEDPTAVDGPPAGDDAIGVGALLDAAVVGPVADQQVEFMERALVEQVVDALAGEQLALGVLSFDRPFGARVKGLFPPLAEVVEPVAHGMLRHWGHRVATGGGPAVARRPGQARWAANRSARSARRGPSSLRHISAKWGRGPFQQRSSTSSMTGASRSSVARRR